MTPSTNRAFCSSCQAEVEAIPAGRGRDKTPTFKCSVCGSTIKQSAGGDEMLFDEISFTDESISVPDLDTVLVVGYTPSIRQLLVDKMMEKHIARQVLPMKNGEDMIAAVIQHMDNEANIDLIVLDVPIPFLNGINAAIGLRAVERTYQEHDLVPILFLTNKPCDDTFKKVIRFLAPAKYATLGPVDDKQALVKHITRILTLLSREKW